MSEIEKGKEYKDERISAYGKYNWLIWLQKNCKENKKVNEMISSIKIVYPEFSPRSKPEISSWSTRVVWSGDISPISEQEMLVMKKEELIPLLVAFKGDEWEGPSREGLLNVFSNCIKSNWDWTRSALEFMIKNISMESDVWRYFFRGMKPDNLDAECNMIVLRKILFDELIENNCLNVSRFFEDVVKSNSMKEHFSEFSEELFEMSIRIWKKRQLEEEFGGCRLIDKCCNGVSGILTSTWVQMISNEKSKTLPNKYRRWFEEILADDDNEQTICILAGQIAYFHALDRQWCKDNLFLYFRGDNETEFKAAWESVAYYSRHLYKELADDMISIYQCAIEKINWLSGEARKGFVELYTVLLIYVIDNPIKSFIPKLFEVAKDEDRKSFNVCIGRALENMDDEQKARLWDAWLQQYIINRMKNIPKMLEEYEKEEMLDWVFEMGDLYPKMLELFSGGMTISKTSSMFWYKMKKDKWANRFPEETGKFISVLLNSGADLSFREIEVKEIATSIVFQNPQSQKKLEEALLKRGL